MLFLSKEALIDAENCKEMLNIEPSHLTKGKITAMSKLANTYKKASTALIKKYKTTNNKKKKHERYSLTAKEKVWIRKG
ncbi:MAG: hypothetical protein GQ570_08460 [Helicobacteraceae bacterium]|nr:hypothetical protein [Helicobacteraceae bacterium]